MTATSATFKVKASDTDLKNDLNLRNDTRTTAVSAQRVTSTFGARIMIKKRDVISSHFKYAPYIATLVSRITLQDAISI